MKIKSLIRLICLTLIVAFLAVWAFNGIVIFTKNFQRLDTTLKKDTELGSKYIISYTLSAKDGEEDFDVSAATDEAVKVFKGRLDMLKSVNGLTISVVGTEVRKSNDDTVLIEIPVDCFASDLTDIIGNNGVLTVTNNGEDLFTNDDVKSIKIKGYDDTDTLYHVELAFNDDAKAKIAELTSNGAYSFTVNMDDVVTSSFSGTEKIKNGKLDLTFSVSSTDTTNTYLDAVKLVCGVGSGTINATITEDTNTLAVSADAGIDYEWIFGLALLALFVFAGVAFIVGNKLFGVAAEYALLCGITLYAFFAATFEWFRLSSAGLMGLMIGELLMVLGIIFVLKAVNDKYNQVKNVEDALNKGVAGITPSMLEFFGVVALIGIALWICGGKLASFGTALLGGSVIAAFTSLFMLKHITKIFMGLGLKKAQSFGFKRGE